jgi:poly(hydroxyalkanoate) depolymerase family esterase
MRRRTVLITLAAGVAAVVATVAIASTGGNSASQPGRIYRARLDLAGEDYPFVVYVPVGYSANSAPALVVVLHGCNTTASQQLAASEYDTLADRNRFVVLYPDVDALDAEQGHCWQGIWAPGAEARSRGDAAAIAEMTRTVTSRWHIDRSRVYAIGISAGAFETSILGADYPDLYAAIGIHSGAAYMGAEQGCLGGAPSPAATPGLSRAALAAMGPRARAMPVIVFHGDADQTVPYGCGEQAVAQWRATDNLVLEHEQHGRLASIPTISHGAVPAGHSYTVSTYANESGCPVVQLWTIHGMGHYWSGGSAAPASQRYSDPRGPSAAANSWAFFSRWRLSGPTRLCSRSTQ